MISVFTHASGKDILQLDPKFKDLDTQSFLSHCSIQIGKFCHWFSDNFHCICSKLRFTKCMYTGYDSALCYLSGDKHSNLEVTV